MRFALKFKLVRVDGQMFISEPYLRYLIDSSKQRASTATAAPHPVWRTATSTQWHCQLQPHSSHFSSCTPRCGYTQVVLPASAGLRRQCLMRGHWPHLRKEERRFGYHFSSFLPSFLPSHKSNEWLRSSFHTASQCNKAAAVQRAEGCQTEPRKSAFPFHRLAALLKIYEYLGARVHNKTIECKVAHVLQWWSCG